MKFNSIIFRDQKTKGFLYMPCKNTKEAYHVDLGEDFMKDERVKRGFPRNKIILADVKQEESDLVVDPVFCIELKYKNKPVNFWSILENEEYFLYFLQKITKKL